MINAVVVGCFVLVVVIVVVVFALAVVFAVVVVMMDTFVDVIVLSWLCLTTDPNRSSILRVVLLAFNFIPNINFQLCRLLCVSSHRV